MEAVMHVKGEPHHSQLPIAHLTNNPYISAPNINALDPEHEILLELFHIVYWHHCAQGRNDTTQLLLEQVPLAALFSTIPQDC
eukprot:9506935-Ditylum_brightwellii.AAC.1